MKYFICAFSGVRVAISAERTERVISVPRQQRVVYEADNGEEFISLPVLFRLEGIAAEGSAVGVASPAKTHGILLKAREGAPPQSDPGTVSKTVLITAPIDIDQEIADEEIHALPRALAGGRQFFSGVSFQGPDMVLILDIDAIEKNSRSIE